MGATPWTEQDENARINLANSRSANDPGAKGLSGDTLHGYLQGTYTPIGGVGLSNGGGSGGFPSFPNFGGGAGGFSLPGAMGGPPGAPGSPSGVAIPGSSSPGPPDMKNFVQNNPGLTWLEDQYKQRFSSDPTQRATDRATSQIRDTASGLMKEAEGDAARRGVLGQGDSGILSGNKAKIGEQALREASKASSGIALGREGQLDSLIGQGTGIMGANAQLGLAQQGLGVRQYEAQQQAELAKMNAAMQQQQMIASLWGTYMNMLR